MKKTVLVFSVSILLLAALGLWALRGRVGGDTGELLMIAGIIILVGFSLYVGFTRFRSHVRREPAEDELTKEALSKAASLSYYISLYLWLFIMWISPRVEMETPTLISFGILGMALAFFFSWVYIKYRGIKNE